MSNNLWNDLTFLQEEKKLPVDILKEQSQYLIDATHGLLYLDIQEYNEIDRAFIFNFDFAYKCILKSNVLTQYGFRILEIRHDTKIFPLELIVSDDIASEVGTSSIISGTINIIKNDADLFLAISDIINSESTKSTMHTLYTLSKN